MYKITIAYFSIVVLTGLELFTLYQLIHTANYRWGVIFIAQLPYVLYYILLQIFKFKEPDPPYRVLFSLTLFGVVYSLITLMQFPNFSNAVSTTVSFFYTSFMAILAWYVPSLNIKKNNKAILPGARMPEVTLQNHQGSSIPLSVLNNQPNLFIFYRGNWCVFCVAQLNKIVSLYKQIEETGIRVVLVSPQKLEDTQELAKKHNVNFTYLIDKNLELADALGIRHKDGAPKSSSGVDSDTVFPTIIFASEKGKILYFEQTDNFRYRPDPDRYLSIIDQLKLQSFLEKKIDERTNDLNEERNKSKKLLLNILPQHVATELMETGKTMPIRYEKTSVLFTDFEGFTKMAEKLTPEALVDELDNLFKVFDEIVSGHHLEKIKTIGDSYMAVGGVPLGNETNAIDSVLVALKMQECMIEENKNRRQKGHPTFELRLGIHTGPLVAGVVGKNKFCYDVWGDTVNFASRLESGGETSKVNISKTTYEEINPFFECTYRGKISAKGKGDVDMYFVHGLKPAFLTPGKTLEPNDAFKSKYLEIKES